MLRVLAIPLLWKRDLKKAFRGVPILLRGLDLSWVVWQYNGVVYCAQHPGMPFGTNSAVYSSHRLGRSLAAVVKSMGKAPVLRYVGDYFGASSRGIKYTGGVMLEILAGLAGRPVGPNNSEDEKDEHGGPRR